jgi:hypothetical protein
MMDMLRATLAESGRPPLERLRRLVHAFVKSECDEAALRARRPVPTGARERARSRRVAT